MYTFFLVLTWQLYYMAQQRSSGLRGLLFEAMTSMDVKNAAARTQNSTFRCDRRLELQHTVILLICGRFFLKGAHCIWSTVV